MAWFPAPLAGRAASLLSLLAIWEAAAWFAHSRLFPGAGAVLATLVDEAVHGDLLHHLGATLARVVTLREGARTLDRDLADMAESFHFGVWRTWRHVTLPQLAPFFLVASRTGLALIWKIVLVVELLGRPDGIGYAIQVFFQLFDVRRLIAYALAFVAVVLAVEWGVLQPLERRLARWRR